MNRREFHIGPGAASLMLIVVVLSMSVLGMLSMMNARSDERLSARGVAVAEETYLLYSAAQSDRAALDGTLLTSAAGAADENAYLAAVAQNLPGNMTLDGRTVRWSENGGAKTLECAAEILPLGEFPRCRFVSHRLGTGMEEIEGMELDDEWN